ATRGGDRCGTRARVVGGGAGRRGPANNRSCAIQRRHARRRDAVHRCRPARRHGPAALRRGAPRVSAACDVAVLGLGATGSAALYHLARSGLGAIGIERFESPHAFGSSHGGSRIIREAYFEDPRYVPLVQRAYEAWAALERDSGRTFMLTTGGVMIGPREGELVSGALRSALAHGLPHELLDAAAIRRRFAA